MSVLHKARQVRHIMPSMVPMQGCAGIWTPQHHVLSQEDLNPLHPLPLNTHLNISVNKSEQMNICMRYASAASITITVTVHKEHKQGTGREAQGKGREVKGRGCEAYMHRRRSKSAKLCWWPRPPCHAFKENPTCAGQGN